MTRLKSEYRTHPPLNLVERRVLIENEKDTRGGEIEKFVTNAKESRSGENDKKMLVEISHELNPLNHEIVGELR